MCDSGRRGIPEGAAMDLLCDEELLETEARLGGEFLRLEHLHPHRRDTTYRALGGSAELLAAWVRWHDASMAARGRGLAPRWCGRA